MRWTWQASPRDKPALSGPERVGELETRQKWPKTGFPARKRGFGPEEGGRRGVGNWRRGKTRKSPRAKTQKKKNEKAGGHNCRQCRGKGRAFYTGSGTRKSCCRVARPCARSDCDAASVLADARICCGQLPCAGDVGCPIIDGRSGKKRTYGLTRVIYPDSRSRGEKGGSGTT